MNTELTVLLVEDDCDLAQAQVAFLSRNHYRCVHVDDENKVLHGVQFFEPDIVLLDRMLQKKDGLQLCREIRCISQVPILFITALTSREDRLAGFAAGADDYICKPFELEELAARMAAVLRRSRSPGKPSSPPLTLDKAGQRLLVGGLSLELTRREFKILELLQRRAGSVVSREELMDYSGDGSSESYDRSIDNHIKNLRKKISQHLPETTPIRTVYGLGYRMDFPGSDEVLE